MPRAIDRSIASAHRRATSVGRHRPNAERRVAVRDTVGAIAAGLASVVGRRQLGAGARIEHCTPGAVSSRSGDRCRDVYPATAARFRTFVCASSAAKFPTMRSEIVGGSARSRPAGLAIGSSRFLVAIAVGTRGRSARRIFSADDWRCRHLHPADAREICAICALPHPRYQPSRPRSIPRRRLASTSSGMSPLSSTASWKP